MSTAMTGAAASACSRRTGDTPSRARPGVLASMLLLAAGAAAAPDADRQAELAHLVRHDCGSCHGLTLAGGLGPPLTADALREAPAPALEATILHGRPGTPMPPWQGLLSADDVRWVVEALKSGRLP